MGQVHEIRRLRATVEALRHKRQRLKAQLPLHHLFLHARLHNWSRVSTASVGKQSSLRQASDCNFLHVNGYFIHLARKSKGRGGKA
jgi:hypothetical protein